MEPYTGRNAEDMLTRSQLLMDQSTESTDGDGCIKAFK